MNPHVGLITDFGFKAGYVASMKGVILSINPDCRIIDLSHEISPQDVKEAAIFLDNCTLYFPEGFMFLVVVDPGVGTDRKTIVLKTRSKGQYFIAPDNGVLDLVIKEQGVDGVVSIENPRYMRDTLSHTFHGRDIMAPVAAHLSRGVHMLEFGPPLDPADLVTLPIIDAGYDEETRTVTGEILYTDRFGNIVTNIKEEVLGNLFLAEGTMLRITMEVPGKSSFTIAVPFHDYYGAVEPGETLCLFNSENRFEIAINQGNAARQYGMENNIGKVIVRES